MNLKRGAILFAIIGLVPWFSVGIDAASAQSGEPAVASSPAPRPTAPSIDDMLTKTPGEMFEETEAAQRAYARAKPPKSPSVDEMVTAGLTGGDGINIAPINTASASTDRQNEARDIAAYKQEQERTRHERPRMAFAALLVLLPCLLVFAFLSRGRQDKQRKR